MVLLQGSHCSIPQQQGSSGKSSGPARGAGNEMAHGYSRQMAELSLEDPSDPSKLMRFTVLLKSRKEKYLMNSLRGDGEHQ